MAARVLFVCVENSCRSQIAEAFARQLGAGVLEAHSAGSRPSGRVHPSAVRLMKELGADLSGYRSKGLDEFSPWDWDYVVTMGCGEACPYVPGRARLDWKIPDPKDLPDEAFREVIFRIKEKVEGLVRAARSHA